MVLRIVAQAWLCLIIPNPLKRAPPAVPGLHTPITRAGMFFNRRLLLLPHPCFLCILDTFCGPLN